MSPLATAALLLGLVLLSPALAHALISVVCNVKLWLNTRAVVQLFYPVRAAGLAYVCSLDDQELRSQPARNIADFLWCSLRDNNNGLMPTLSGTVEKWKPS